MKRYCAIFLAAGLAAGGGRAWGDDVMKGVEVGPETTVVSGPLNADGTINYLAAANAEMGKGVKPEENAAVVLIQTMERGHAPYELPEELYKELGVAVTPEGEERFVSIGKWMKEHVEEAGGAHTGEEELDWSLATEHSPWTREKYPVVAKWLEGEGKYLEMVGEASKRKKYFAPMVSTEDPPSMTEAFKHRLDVPLLSLRIAMTTRANERIGETDFAGAMRDLKTLQQLGRLTGHDLDMGLLMAAASYNEAMQGYRWIALSAGADKKLLRELTDALGEEFSAQTMGNVERFYGLDTIMQAAQGKEQPWLRLLALDFSGTREIADDDLHGADWNVVMRSFNRRLDQIDALVALPREKRRAVVEKMKADEVAAGLPQSILSGLAVAKQLEPGEHQKELEAFFVRRAGETREAYSERVAILFTGDVETVVRMENVMLRPVAEQRLTRTTIALAAYKLDMGKWPEKLEELVPTYLASVAVDPFSDGVMKYRREGTGFLLYSVGLNETDDGGKVSSAEHADDMAVTAEKAVQR